MKSLYGEQPVDYTGEQLRSHYIYAQCGVPGDAIIAFSGKCDVKPEAIVDVEDILARNKIYSEHMLHFIVEHYGMDLSHVISRQLLLAAIVQDSLQQVRDIGSITRKGSDLFDADAKLTVSVATVSPVSALIHFGINISSANTPVKTKGLNDYGIDPRDFALSVMERYVQDHDHMDTARHKVRWVS